MTSRKRRRTRKRRKRKGLLKTRKSKKMRRIVPVQRKTKTTKVNVTKTASQTKRYPLIATQLPPKKTRNSLKTMQNPKNLLKTKRTLPTKKK